MGTLFLVATPIGNLGDITLRAIQVLSKVDYIACEDTRRTGLLLNQINKSTFLNYHALIHDNRNKKPPLKLISYYEQSELRRIPEIISLLKAGQDVALVSDSGMPTISDPGFKLVREAIYEKIKVESIPGPSAVLTALTSSGLPTDKFLFLGYLPKKQGKRKLLLSELFQCFKSLKNIHPTLIFFEAPHRLLKTLEEMREIFGDIEIVICRELTKIHEEIRREKISETIKHFEQVKPKGEFTILLKTPSRF